MVLAHQAYPITWKKSGLRLITQKQKKILPKLPADVSLLKMRLYGFYDHAVVEILPHLLLKFILYLNQAINSKSFIPWFYKNLVPKFLAHSTVVNESADGLTLHTLHHATFQHL